ncbi:hypothetical protein [uncultured Vibrio sp.]|uniref:glutamine amidotransferase-related protein n=1 Tax=uncultured Vibrio sp. TaxID=114054 RepID=UPI0025F35370|nr:hypothetical protein [uncultured Vibrio sp.]
MKAEVTKTRSAGAIRIGILAAGDTPSALKDAFPSFSQMTSEMFLTQLPHAMFETFDVKDDHFPIDVAAMDAWVVTGSVCSSNDELPWMLKLESFIQEAEAQRIKLIGICFGHQLIAKALGGKVAQYHGGWGVGLHEYHGFSKNNRVVEDKTALWLPAFHQDQVVDKPENAEVILHSPFCQNAALLYGDSAFTCQFHPEFSVEFERALLTLYQDGVIPQDVLKKAHQSLLDRQPDNATIVHLLCDFVAN